MKLFDQIDSELYKKEEKDRYAIYLLIVIVIGFLFYYFVFPVAESTYNKSLNENKNLKSKISTLKKDIRNKESALAKNQKDIKKLNHEVKKIQNKYEKVKKDIEMLYFVVFDANEWAKLLKNSVMNAIKEGMEIRVVSSNVEDVKGYLKCFVKEKQSKNIKTSTNLDKILNEYINCHNDNSSYKFINKKLTFTLFIRSRYKNLLSYIYEYENRKELFRVDSLSITQPNTYVLKISLYGYEK